MEYKNLYNLTVNKELDLIRNLKFETIAAIIKEIVPNEEFCLVPSLTEEVSAIIDNEYNSGLLSIKVIKHILEINEIWKEQIKEYKKLFTDEIAPDATDKALKFFAQYILSCPIRAFLGANKILVQNRCGFISIPEYRWTEFEVMLRDFKETGNNNALLYYLHTYCITG